MEILILFLPTLPSNISPEVVVPKNLTLLFFDLIIKDICFNSSSVISPLNTCITVCSVFILDKSRLVSNSFKSL